MIRAAFAVVASAALSLALAGCSGSAKPVARPTAPPVTPIGRLNTAALSLARVDFCSLVPQAAVTAAVGSSGARGSSYGDGDQAQITEGTSDVAQELACAWTDGSTTARAWMFDRSVTPALARSVKRQAGHRPGCRLTAGPRFGDPTLKQVCTGGGTARVRYAGLFGDTWLTCEVTGALPRATAEDRAGAWCVAVATALNTTR